MSRDGIIPLALSFDTGGPMARHVSDVAVALGVMAGVDPADEATRKGEGRAPADYTTALDAGALSGARIGVARDFMSADGDVDWVVESALDAMRRAGATIVDVRYPTWLLDVKEQWYRAVRWREFPVQISAYLATLALEYPKTLDELIARARRVNAPRPDGAGPNPSRWSLFAREAKSGAIEDAEYAAVRDHGLEAMRVIVEGLFAAEKLEAAATCPRR